MSAETLFQQLLHGNRLKQTPRTGWVLRGVVDAESVAAHSYGVGYICLLLAQHIEEPIDLAQLLTMAILHDLPEGVSGDLPKPAAKFLPQNAKKEMEAKIWAEMDLGEELSAVFSTLQAKQTPEAKLLKDADKLDLYLQAYQYEQQQGNRLLAEFWDKEPTFTFTICENLYKHIHNLRYT